MQNKWQSPLKQLEWYLDGYNFYTRVLGWEKVTYFPQAINLDADLLKLSEQFEVIMRVRLRLMESVIDVQKIIRESAQLN